MIDFDAAPYEGVLDLVADPALDVVVKYREDQARDERGRWTSDGGSGWTDPRETHKAAWDEVIGDIRRQGQGNCYPAAGTIAMHARELGLRNVRVVQATAVGQGRIKGKPFGHSWVEADGPAGIRVAYDYSSGNSAVLPADLYRSLGHVTDVHEYTVDEALKAMVRSKHWGPW